MNHKNIKEFQKLEREQKRYTHACAVLGEILKEHPELTGCIQTVSSYVITKMEVNDKRLSELYGRHGEGLTIER